MNNDIIDIYNKNIYFNNFISLKFDMRKTLIKSKY